jgi:hypothetical protein
MTTYAEDVRLVLAEVDPDTAALICEPTSGRWWAHIGTTRKVSREQYLLIRRAGQLVRERRPGGTGKKRCDDCAWTAYSTRDNEAKERHALEGCGHL